MDKKSKKQLCPLMSGCPGPCSLAHNFNELMPSAHTTFLSTNFKSKLCTSECSVAFCPNLHEDSDELVLQASGCFWTITPTTTSKWRFNGSIGCLRWTFPTSCFSKAPGAPPISTQMLNRFPALSGVNQSASSSSSSFDEKLALPAPRFADLVASSDQLSHKAVKKLCPKLHRCPGCPLAHKFDEV